MYENQDAGDDAERWRWTVSLGSPCTHSDDSCIQSTAWESKQQSREMLTEQGKLTQESHFGT